MVLSCALLRSSYSALLCCTTVLCCDALLCSDTVLYCASSWCSVVLHYGVLLCSSSILYCAPLRCSVLLFYGALLCSVAVLYCAPLRSSTVLHYGALLCSTTVMLLLQRNPSVAVLGIPLSPLLPVPKISFLPIRNHWDSESQVTLISRENFPERRICWTDFTILQMPNTFSNQNNFLNIGRFSRRDKNIMHACASVEQTERGKVANIYSACQ